MATVTRSVELSPALSAVGVAASVFGGGGFATLSVQGGEREVTKAVQVIRALGLKPHRPGEAPPGLPMANPRFGDVVALAPVGTAISRGPGPSPRGSHGYLPGDPGMGALLIAAGGGVPRGRRLGQVRNLDVAPTLLAWLGILPPEWMEGRPIAGLVAAEPAPRTPVDSQPGEER
jgi:hypothetical protein